MEGTDFNEKHIFFDKLAEQLGELIDSVAERIRMLGHYAPASLKSFLELSQLEETATTERTNQSFVRELLIDHETIIRHLGENINILANDYEDHGTSDFITGLIQQSDF